MPTTLAKILGTLTSWGLVAVGVGGVLLLVGSLLSVVL